MHLDRQIVFVYMLNCNILCDMIIYVCMSFIVEMSGVISFQREGVCNGLNSTISIKYILVSETLCF